MLRSTLGVSRVLVLEFKCRVETGRQALAVDEVTDDAFAVLL